jgi:RNA polymerase sigma factor (sigma-70 family)
MTPAHPNRFVYHIRHLVGSVSDAALTDGQLLERFLAHRDESAVELLVRRYGSLVFGVCRRVLHNAHAAEDAFQATFLVLLRKAPSLDGSRPLGTWLYTVAYRLALRARTNELRRQRCERRAADRRPPTEDRAASPSELLVALEEELHRLPERHRAPLVLCYLEGKTNEQAAELLRCPRGSMAARLAQARERLRECLTRRGFVAPAAGVAAALAAGAARADVPLPLLENTVRAALWFAREEAGAAGCVSTQALALARGAFRAMCLNRLKVAALLLAVALLGTGTTFLVQAAAQAGRPAQAPDVGRPQRAEAPGAVPDRSANAAAPYGQAFLALRRGVGDRDKLVAECLTMPLDAHAREIVSRAAYALRMVQRGAALPGCDWARDSERGIEISYTRGEAAQVLAALACLRARLRFEQGRSAEALDDLVAALTLARHVGRDGTLDSLWAGYQIEERLSAALALYLPRLDTRELKALKTRCDALPPGGSVATATLRMQENLLNWIVGEVQEAKDKEALLAFLSQLCGWKSDPPEKNQARGRACLEECGGTAAGVLKSAEELRPHAAPLAKRLDLPPDQVATEFEREARKLTGNPVFKVFAPVLENVRMRQARAQVRRGLLAAALAVQLEGREALKRHPDPVVGGPFEYVPSAGSFELRSKLKGADDKPLTLPVGPDGR